MTFALAAIAIGLRAWHLGHGLPDLNEEAFPFRHAVALWGADGAHSDWNPHWFAYPSLTVYLQYMVQRLSYFIGHFTSPADFLLALAINPTSTVVLGRSIGVLADLVTLVCVGRVARRFGQSPACVAMGLVAVAPTMIRTSRLIYADSVMTALLLAAIERMLVYSENKERRFLFQGAVLWGLATGAKYPAVALVVPLIVAIWRTEARAHAIRLSLAALLLGVAAFLCTTPFVIVSWSEFLRDLSYMQDTTTMGSLGSQGGSALSYAWLRLTENLGWAGVVLLLTSAISGLAWRARSDTRFLWVAFAVVFIPVASVPVLAERYLVPSIAIGACLVAAGVSALSGSIRRYGWGVLAGSIVLVMLQPAWSGIAAARGEASTTQLQAKLWCQGNLRDTDLVLSEAYGPNLLTHEQRAEVMGGALYQAASSPLQLAYRSQRAFHMVWMPLLVGGYALVRLPTASGPELAVYPHAVDWNAAAYDVRLLQGIDYVITTDAVRGRFAADSARFREQARFYALLDRTAQVAAKFTPGRGLEGPSISIYRLTPASRSAIALAGPLDSLWWARTVPAQFKQVADSLMASGFPGAGSDVGVPLWALALKGAYGMRYGAFALDLAQHLASVGHGEAASDILVAALTIAPEDASVAALYALVASGTDDDCRVAKVLGRSVTAIALTGPIPPEIVRTRAEALRRCGPAQGRSARL